MQPLMLEIRGPLVREDLPGLHIRAMRRLSRRAGGATELELKLVRVAADAVAIDALATVALLARRSGCVVCLRRPDPELWRLIELSGLTEVFRSRSSPGGAGQPRLGG